MKRRDYLKTSAAVAGYTLIFGGVAATIKACKVEPTLDWSPVYLTTVEALLISDISERIIPKTDTPGAKDAMVDRFIDANIADNFTPEQKGLFRKALVAFDEKAKASFSNKFIDLKPEEQDEVLQAMSDEAKNHEGDVPHIFNVLKDMTVFGFFTSKVGAMACLKYDPIPGDYQGCIDYSEVNGVWAF
ncbi:MAG: gluconate 2-dehydrogenase subunit 3 family protein [Saprospiraceae bacterium]|nr:gluconate 2-dehydrogenase subunit 3 family protein [Saprospiraceae bacterium]